MSVISKKQLLEAGVHFGHNTRRWNPKMKEYIYEERNGVYIIDLAKTEKLIEESYKILYTIAQNGGQILFVGTRKQTQDVIKEEATRCNMFYVDQRWLGGTLTNFKTIKKSVAKLFKIDAMEEDGTFSVLPKKEVILLKKEKEKLERNFGGIKTLNKVPDAMVVVDPKTEHNAVAEARKLNIPIFGLVDTNCDPDEVDYVIPANDDAIRSVKLIIATLANAVVEANGGTPIEIVFTDEPVVEEQKPRRNNNYRDNNRGGYGNRDNRDNNRGGYGNKESRPYTPRPQGQREDRPYRVSPTTPAPVAQAPAQKTPVVEVETPKVKVTPIKAVGVETPVVEVEAPKAKRTTKKAVEAETPVVEVEAPKAKRTTKKAVEAETPVVEAEAPKAKRATKKTSEKVDS